MVFVSSVPNIFGYRGEKEDYLLCTDFTGKKYSLKLFNPIFLSSLSLGSFCATCDNERCFTERHQGNSSTHAGSK